jgi:hypothetical protein
VGGWNAPLLPVEEFETEVVGVVVLEDPTPVPPGAEVGVTGAGGGFTLKSVPVTTVTWDPDDTCVGSRAMITPPVMEFATAWAAARLAGDFEE